MKRTSLIAAFIALMLLPGMAFAQVYKCKGKSGESVYSEHPCDASAQPMKLREERPATGGGFVAPPPATPENVESSEGSEPMPAAPELDRSAERECIAAATLLLLYWLLGRTVSEPFQPLVVGLPTVILGIVPFISTLVALCVSWVNSTPASILWRRMPVLNLPV